MTEVERRFFGELLEMGRRAHRAEALQKRVEEVVAKLLMDRDVVRLERDEAIDDVRAMTRGLHGAMGYCPRGGRWFDFGAAMGSDEIEGSSRVGEPVSIRDIGR
ncbi:hypothetical protein ACLOJK_002950 [Asimina triloba]